MSSGRNPEAEDPRSSGHAAFPWQSPWLPRHWRDGSTRIAATRGRVRDCARAIYTTTTQMLAVATRVLMRAGIAAAKRLRSTALAFVMALGACASAHAPSPTAVAPEPEPPDAALQTDTTPPMTARTLDAPER